MSEIAHKSHPTVNFVQDMIVLLLRSVKPVAHRGRHSGLMTNELTNRGQEKKNLANAARRIRRNRIRKTPHRVWEEGLAFVQKSTFRNERASGRVSVTPPVLTSARP